MWLVSDCDMMDAMVGLHILFGCTCGVVLCRSSMICSELDSATNCRGVVYSLAACVCCNFSHLGSIVVLLGCTKSA